MIDYSSIQHHLMPSKKMYIFLIFIMNYKKCFHILMMLQNDISIQENKKKYILQRQKNIAWYLTPTVLRSIFNTFSINELKARCYVLSSSLFKKKSGNLFFLVNFCYKRVFLFSTIDSADTTRLLRRRDCSCCLLLLLLLLVVVLSSFD